MKKFTLIGGLPRAGSSLLCNILNSNPEFHVTPTSATIDVIRNIRSTYSHNISYKAQNRLELMENFRKGLLGFFEGYFYNHEKIFDKCRGWTSNISLLDEILGHKKTKIIWCYRSPVEIIASIEAQYQKTILLENTDEQNMPGAFTTLDRRIGTLINEGGLVSYPVEILKDSIESGYLDRILFIKYFDLTNNPKETLDTIHKFIGEEQYSYDFNNIKQTTFENDSFYNYKFPHTIKEGEIKFKQADIKLPEKYIQIINDRFVGLNKFIFEGDINSLIGFFPQQPQIIEEQQKDNPFSVE